MRPTLREGNWYSPKGVWRVSVYWTKNTDVTPPPVLGRTRRLPFFYQGRLPS